MPYKNIDEQREYQRQWMAARRRRYVALRGGCCEKCGSTVCLEFHHRDRRAKISHKVWSWAVERIEAELVKCDLLCTDCHKVETAFERGYGTASHGTLSSYKDYACRCADCRSTNAAYEHKRRQTLRTV